jgi:hypothetical protein
MASEYKCPKCNTEGQENGSCKEVPGTFGTVYSFPYICPNPECNTKWKVVDEEQVDIE